MLILTACELMTQHADAKTTMRPPTRSAAAAAAARRAPDIQPAVAAADTLLPMQPEFGAISLVQKELAAYSDQCPCAQSLEAERARAHASLERVLVLDARGAWNGLGNSLSRWVGLLRVGHSLGYATFLWLNGAGSDAPSRGDARFDIGDYFVSVGVDWQWNRRTRRRVAAAMRRRGQSHPFLARAVCKRMTFACMEPVIEWEGGRRSAGCSYDEELGGGLLRVLRSLNASWLQLELAGGQVDTRATSGA